MRDSSCFWGVRATRNIVHHDSHICQETNLTLIAITSSPIKAQKFMTCSCLLHTSKSRERNSQNIGTLSAWVVFQVYKGTEDCIRVNCLRQSSCVQELQHFILDCTLQPLHFCLPISAALAPIHYVQCGMEAESTCQCQSLSSKHREIHHDLHKMGSGTYRKEEWVWRQIEIHHDLVSGTEKEILGPKINYWELWSRLTPAGGEEEVQWHVEPPPILASVRAAPHPFQKTLAAVSLVHSKKNSDALASLATCLLLVSSFDGCNKSCVVRVWGSSSFQGFVRYLLHCLGSWSPMCKNHKKQTMVGLGFQGSFLLLGSSDSGISAAEGAEETEVS